MRQVPFKSVLAGLAIFGIGIGGSIQLTQSKPKAETRETISSAWRVSTQYARLQTVSPVFNGFGSVQNPDTQTLKARVLTDVTGLYAREGTRVHAGQLLVELDATEAEQEENKDGEPRGTGVNEFVYWITNSPLEDWIQLKDITPA